MRKACMKRDVEMSMHEEGTTMLRRECNQTHPSDRNEHSTMKSSDRILTYIDHQCIYLVSN